MKLAAVVIADQAGHLLEPFRLELHHRLGVEAVRLLPPRHQRLAEKTAQGFPAIKPQISRTFGEAEKLLRPRRAQPLKVQRQGLAVEVFALWGWRKNVLRQRRRSHSGVGDSRSITGAEPAVLRPQHRLDRGLAPQRATAPIANGA